MAASTAVSRKTRKSLEELDDISKLVYGRGLSSVAAPFIFLDNHAELGANGILALLGMQPPGATALTAMSIASSGAIDADDLSLGGVQALLDVKAFVGGSESSPGIPASVNVAPPAPAPASQVQPQQLQPQQQPAPQPLLQVLPQPPPQVLQLQQPPAPPPLMQILQQLSGLYQPYQQPQSQPVFYQPYQQPPSYPPQPPGGGGNGPSSGGTA